MQYGYFDLEHKEYVITRPDTPAPWANYLGSPEYGAIVSNNGGGYSFVKSGANGRIIRYRFNSNIGLPGRYIYIRDNDAKDYWSCTWQPVGKPLDQYKTECHHGTAYTTIKSDYADIHSELTYYVPLNKTYEVWRTKITNNSDRYRNLSTFGFVEFTNENNYEQDQVNLQYTLFITRTSFEGNKIVQHINENSGKDENGSNWRERFFGVVGAPVSAYNGNLDSFIGSYRTYGNPVAVERGFCDNKLNYNSNACGALQSDIILAPGETKEIIYVVGQKNPKVADEILAAYNEPGKVDAEVKELIAYWHGQLNNFQIETPSDEFNNMVNVWNAYQCFITFIWSRAASFIYCGLRNGYGYRDTVQDIQGIIHINPELAAEKIRFMISAQVDNGGGLPLVKFDHKAGHETCPDENDENSIYAKETGHPCYRADDALWLFPTVNKYIGESGNKAFLDEVIVYANGGEDTVYEHLKRAINFSMERLGAHTMPAGLYADWNDCLRLGKKGESTFVAFQLYYAMSIIKGYALDRGDIKLSDYKLDQWRLMHIGAQPVPPSLIKRWKEYFPNHQYDTNYGLSESTGPGCVHLGVENIDKVGAIGVPGYRWECKIVDENDNEVAQGGVGELCVKGPGVMTCYYNDEKSTSEVLKDGWLYTGDMAMQDEQGFYYLVDRKKDVIVSGGENIYPVQIEDFLRRHDKIKDVAVIGLSDRRLGEKTAAIIEIKDGMVCSKEEIEEFCHALPRYKRPKEIIFADIPRNATGKIEKPKLRKIYGADNLVAKENQI